MSLHTRIKIQHNTLKWQNPNSCTKGTRSEESHKTHMYTYLTHQYISCLPQRTFITLSHEEMYDRKREGRNFSTAPPHLNRVTSHRVTTVLSPSLYNTTPVRTSLIRYQNVCDFLALQQRRGYLCHFPIDSDMATSPQKSNSRCSSTSSVCVFTPNLLGIAHYSRSLSPHCRAPPPRSLMQGSAYPVLSL